MGISGLKDLTLKIEQWVLVLLFTFLIQVSVIFEAMAADTTIKGTTADSNAASLEVTNSSNTSLLYVRNDGNVGVGTASPNQELTIEGTMSLKEQADADADTVAYGQVWVKDTAPNTLYFTDDAGTDVQLGFTSRCSVGLAGNQPLVHDVWTKVLFATEDYDNDGEFTSNRFTAKKAGWYHVDSSLYVIVPVLVRVELDVRVNGTSKRFHRVESPANYACPVVSADIYLDVGGYVEIWAQQDGDDDRTIYVGVATWFNIHRFA